MDGERRHDRGGKLGFAPPKDITDHATEKGIRRRKRPRFVHRVGERQTLSPDEGMPPICQHRERALNRTSAVRSSATALDVQRVITISSARSRKSRSSVVASLTAT
jgi:hypothetical protein